MGSKSCRFRHQRKSATRGAAWLEIALPRPAPAARIGRDARRGALETSGRAFAARSDQREHGALRVDAADDPGAAHHIGRAFEDLAAGGPGALGRGVDVADAEVIEPERNRRCRGLGEHAADCLSCAGEQLIGPTPVSAFCQPSSPA